MKKRLTIIIVLVVVAIVGYMLWNRLSTRAKLPPGTLDGNGVIEATEVDVTAEVAGKIITLPVQEGDEVQKDQLIAILNTGGLQGQVEQAQGNLKSAQANLAALLAGSRQEDIARSRAQYEVAQKALQQAQASRALVYAGPRAEDIAQLQAALAQAQSQRDLVKAGPRQEVIDQLRTALNSAQVTQKNAELDFSRAEKLFAQGAIAAQRVDQARTARDVAANQTKIAQSQLDAALAGSRPQEIATAEAAVQQAQQRLREAKNGARPQERAQADAAVAQAQAQVSAAKAVYDLTLAGARTEDIAAARARVEQAQGAVNSAATIRAQTKIFSPANARVTTRNLEPGDLVTPGTPIVQLAELKQVWLRVYVAEPQVGLVKLGQRADVTTDSYNGKKFSGKVTEIAQEPEFTPKNIQTKDERVKLVFGVKITIDNPTQELKPGMPADALIYIGK